MTLDLASKLYADNWDKSTEDLVQKLSGPILIIGGSGFIGAKLFFSLLKRRNDVYAASQQPERSWRLIRVAPDRLIRLDIRNLAQVKRVLTRIRPKHVINLSAYGGYSWQRDFELIHATNYTGVLNLLNVCRELGIESFVQAGSSSEYGLNSRAPAEKDDLQPNSDYSVAKIGAAKLIYFYGKIQGMPTMNLRLYSIYGPWEDKDRLISKLVQSSLEGRFPTFASAEISRDFVYVDDCTNAIVRACADGCRKFPGESVNIASGNKSTLHDVAMTAKRIFKIDGVPEFGSMPNRKWDLAEWFGDPTLAKSTLGWLSQTSFEKGLLLTAEWFREAKSMVWNMPSIDAGKKISAVVACYRDDQAIPLMYERLTRAFQASKVEYEIIFVNDGSPQADGAVIDALSREDSHVIGIHHSRNFGSQSAFLSGLEVFSGDAAILFDGDLQDPPELVPELIVQWNKGHDVVYGQRVNREAPWYMQILYKTFYRIFRNLADVNIPVDAGDFSLIDRKVVEQMLRCTERDFFVRGIRAWVGFRQIGVPYTRPERRFGQTTNSFLKNIWWAKKGIFSFSNKPIHYIQGLGIVLFLISIGLILFYMTYYLMFPEERSQGFTTVILLVLGLGGIQLISLSILGDYISKITEEVKNRPRSVRARIVSGSDVFADAVQMNAFIRRQNRLSKQGAYES